MTDPLAVNSRVLPTGAILTISLYPDEIKIDLEGEDPGHFFELLTTLISSLQ